MLLAKSNSIKFDFEELMVQNIIFEVFDLIIANLEPFFYPEKEFILNSQNEINLLMIGIRFITDSTYLRGFFIW